MTEQSDNQVGRPRKYDKRMTTAIRIEPELHEKLVKAAEERDVSLNFLANRALEYFLQRLIPVDEIQWVRDDSRKSLYRPQITYPKRGYTQNWNGQGPNTVVLPNKEEAERVLSALIEVLDRFGFVTLNDLYDLTGLRTDRGGATSGWKNLSGAKVKETTDGHHGWFLDLPPMIELEAG